MKAPLNPDEKNRLAFLAVLVPILAGAYLILWPGAWLAPSASRAAGLAVIVISLLATAIVPEYLAALLLFFIGVLFHVAEPAVVFSGFRSTAVWLVFGGLVLGVAISGTGLGRRIAHALAGRLAGSYAKVISGMVLSGILLAFLMPSAMGRVVLLMPITLELAEYFGFEKGSNGRTGLVLAAVMGSFIPAFSILPANVPNMILSGLSNDQLSTTFYYGEYLLLHFPVLGLLKAGAIIAILLRIFPDTPKTCDTCMDVQSGPMQRGEKVLAGVLAMLIFLWMTDFFHHVSPAWIALGGAIFLLLPPVGIVTAEQFHAKVNFGLVLFVAGIIGLGGIINDSGLGLLVGGKWLSVLPLSPDTPFVNFVSTALASTLTGILTTLPGIPAVMVPFTEQIAKAAGFSVKSVLMLNVIGFSTMLLPYQAPPVLVAMKLSGEKVRKAFKPLLLLAVVTYLVLVPLDFLWWKLLGRI